MASPPDVVARGPQRRCVMDDEGGTGSTHSKAERRQKHAAFHMGFIWTALAVALGAGFSTGTHLSFVIGLGFPVSQGFASFIQAHGHAQLTGWAGLFVMGISLHFIPRLGHVPILRPQRLGSILWLMGVGIALRSIGQSIAPYLTQTPVFTPILWLLVASGGLEWCGILSYVFVLLQVFRGTGNQTRNSALLGVRPYFLMLVTGWTLYANLNLVLLVQMALGRFVVVHATWNQLAIQIFVGLILLPVAFAFSVRMFPLYLRLSVPDGPVRGLGYAYLLALLVQVLPTVPPLLRLAPQLNADLSSLGMLLKGCVIIWFVWQLDLLTRRRRPWTEKRQLQPGPERRSTRSGLPDYGEFGRFERLVYASYMWLMLAACGDIMVGIGALLQRPFFVSPNAILHTYLMGFVTLLILGMAVRMIPGFLRKRRVASPALVDATFWLGNLAVVCRLLLFVVPPELLTMIPAVLMGVRVAFSVSGVLALAAVLCLAINLWRTASLD